MYTIQCILYTDNNKSNNRSNVRLYNSSVTRYYSIITVYSYDYTISPKPPGIMSSGNTPHAYTYPRGIQYDTLHGVSRYVLGIHVCTRTSMCKGYVSYSTLSISYCYSSYNNILYYNYFVLYCRSILYYIHNIYIYIMDTIGSNNYYTILMISLL